MRRVVLFDIDGTLVDCAGAGRVAMERAFARETGRDDVLGFSFGGMTDRAIARAGLVAAEREASEAAIDAVLARYLDELEQSLAEQAAVRALPGVSAVLDALEPRAQAGHLAIGLGTGNVRAGAMLKLGRVQLAGRFSFGGFGCDAEDRAELLDAGLRRGASKLGAEAREVLVVVVGDTPKDVAAARKIRGKAVAVATGPFGEDALARTGADVVLPGLDAAGILEAILG